MFWYVARECREPDAGFGRAPSLAGRVDTVVMRGSSRASTVTCGWNGVESVVIEESEITNLQEVTSLLRRAGLRRRYDRAETIEEEKKS